MFCLCNKNVFNLTDCLVTVQYLLIQEPMTVWLAPHSLPLELKGISFSGAVFQKTGYERMIVVVVIIVTGY